MKNLIKALIFLPLCLQLTSCSDDDDNNNDNNEIPVTLPENITFESPSLYPEDFAYDSNNQRFFTGSAFTGNIVTVDLEGNVTTFADSEDLIATVGLLFDEANNQVVVCNTNPGFSDQGQTETTGVLSTVVRYDAATGDVVSSHDLSTLFEGPHLINDIVLDDEGNLFVTDSFSPAIYKITSDGVASLFATDTLFETAPMTFGLNGIEFHPDGYLLVTHYQNQILYKVSIADPTDITVVEVDTEIGSGDGIRLMDNNNLLFVSNSLGGGDHTVYSINSTNDWSTGVVSNSVSLGNGADFPTTVEFADSTPYVISSYIAELATDAGSETSTFEINQINF